MSNILTPIHVLTPIRKTEVPAQNPDAWDYPCRRFIQSCNLVHRRDNEARNRNQLKTHASFPYTILMDADVVCESDTISRMVAVMDKHLPIPAAVVDTKGKTDSQTARLSDLGHAIIALMIIRFDVLQSITFGHIDLHYDHPDLMKDFCCRGYNVSPNCVCTQVNAQIRSITGFPVPYIRGIHVTERRKV